MKILTISISLLLTTQAFANKKHEPKSNSPLIEVSAMNSPVKEDTAKFLVTVPIGFEIDKAKYKIKNATHIFDKSDKHEELNLTKQGSNYIASVDVKKLPPGQYQFFLKVVDKKDKKEHGCQNTKNKKLKDYTNFVVDESIQVPDPGEKGKKTLAGIDSDNDGVRDDVQRWINGTSESFEVKQALKQISRGLQLAIINSNNKVNAISYLDYFQQGIFCMWGVKGFKAAKTLKNELKDKHLNTLDRVKAFELSNYHSHGSGGTGPSGVNEELSYCQF